MFATHHDWTEPREVFLSTHLQYCFPAICHQAVVNKQLRAEQNLLSADYTISSERNYINIPLP